METHQNTKKETAKPARKETLIGIASDHGGIELKEQLVAFLKTAGYGIKDCGAYQINAGDDYSGFIIPLAKGLVEGKVSMEF